MGVAPLLSLEAKQVEQAVGTLISRCLSLPLVARKDMREYRFSQSKCWAIFSCGSGHQFGIALEDSREVSRYMSTYANILSVARGATRIDKESGVRAGRPRIVESFSEAVPLHMHRYELVDRRNSSRSSQQVWYAETRPGLIMTIVGECDRPLVVSINLLRESWEVYLVLHESGFETSALDGYLLAQRSSTQFFRIIPFSASVKGQMILLEINKGDEMDLEVDNVESLNKILSVSICVGSIELSVQDIDQLRPGMTLEFDAPEMLEGVLKLGADDWMRVKLVPDANRARIVVQTESFI